MTPAERDEAVRRATRARGLSRGLGVTALVSAALAIASYVVARNLDGADMGGVIGTLAAFLGSLVLGGLALLLGAIAASYWASSRPPTDAG